ASGTASRPTTGQRGTSRPTTGQRARSGTASRPSTGRTLVFVGPTLSADEVRERLPDADVRPPAAVGDILRAAHESGVRRIALIDGYFERMAAVWHKEILIAIERGIEVWGAASMGALRAAELEAFGMRGVGTIYGWFKQGVITADDEVAVAHMPAEYRYKAVSDALVNIRYTLAVAADEGKLAPKVAAEILAKAKATFYRERVWSKLCSTKLALVDLKADDARRLLAKLRGAGKQPRRKIRVPRTWALRQLERLMLG
ncbi:MAG TPA: TfuA-like protein, partial [Kofleriaceae bacterium]|nr:TfuA-like protein [Kofleriaceae bacterium]